MYRKIFFLSLTLLLLAAGCIPVGEFEVGVEPTAMETPTVIEPDPTDSPEVVEPTAEPTEAPDEFGEVSGKVCFPSEFIPEMTLYFRNTTNGNLHALRNGENVSTYTNELPVGTYIAFAYPEGGGTYGGLYSAAVSCGLDIDCVDHAPLPFDVLAGQTTEGIDLCDWYTGPGVVPVNPQTTFQVNPSLAGLVYRDLNVGGIWLVGEGGIASPLLDKSDAVISKDGRLALFEENDDVFLADLEAGTWTNLTETSDRWESSPQFVPGDAGLVFFFSAGMDEERMSGQLTVIGQDGTGYSVLAEPASSVEPAFSADGSQMAFSLGDTAWIYEFATGMSTAFDPADYGLSGVRFIVSPSYSPDGTQLGWWVSIGESGSSQSALALFDLAAGTHQLMHSYTPVGGGGFNSAPAWSSDGSWFVTTVLSENSKASLWVMSPDGEEIELGNLAYPVWSPDGGALVLTQWPADGGPAWESTSVLYLAGEWLQSTLDLNMGSIALAFIDL